MRTLVSGLLLAAGLYACVTAFRLGVWDWGEPGAGLFPLAFGGLLAALSAVEFARGLRAAAVAKPAEPQTETTADPLSLGTARFGAYAGALVVYVATFALLGFLASTVAAFALLLFVGERAPLRQALAVLAGALLLGYGVMQWMLGVPLPRGPFG